MTLGVIYIIIKFTEGFRKIPLIYTRTGRDEKSYFPIRVNQAGMIPIIFAVSIVTFPALIGQVLSNRGAGTSAKIGQFLLEYFSMNNPSWLYIGVYFLLVLGFSFFYISIVFNTEEVAESIQKRGGYIPGVRPGRETAEYLEKTSLHLNLYGGSFLALIAVFPYLMSKLEWTCSDSRYFRCWRSDRFPYLWSRTYHRCWSSSRTYSSSGYGVEEL